MAGRPRLIGKEEVFETILVRLRQTSGRWIREVELAKCVQSKFEGRGLKMQSARRYVLEAVADDTATFVRGRTQDPDNGLVYAVVRLRPPQRKSDAPQNP